jgi:diguanylate cyclase (GGDEF)-like protein
MFDAPRGTSLPHWGHKPTAENSIWRSRGAVKGSRRMRKSWLVHGLAARLGLCALGASAVVSTALTLLALGSLGSRLAAGGIDAAQLSRWAWTTNVVIVLATTAVTYALAVWRLRPLLALAAGARRLALGEAGVRVDPGDAVAEVRALAESFNHMASRLDESHRELDRRHRELERANAVLEQLSVTDGLTQLYNHRHFQTQLLREAKRAERSGDPLCLLLVDVDDFKGLNDRLGHSAGDRVLQEIARAMQEQIRETDYLARYGGEEFVLLLPHTTVEGAAGLAEKVRGAVEALAAPVIGPQGRVQVTVSIGLAPYAKGPEATFDAADRALYEAKAAGKNRVAISHDVPA